MIIFCFIMSLCLSSDVKTSFAQKISFVASNLRINKEKTIKFNIIKCSASLFTSSLILIMPLMQLKIYLDEVSLVKCTHATEL